MVELPEAAAISNQINEYIGGRRIISVIAAHTPHKFAWYHGDPHGYNDLLADKKVSKAKSCGGMTEISENSGPWQWRFAGYSI
jgi:formamidopyrimidine-DNA glycosylase